MSSRSPLTPAHWPVSVRWLVLIVGSLFLGAGLEATGLSAAFLLGPMMVAIIQSVLGGTVRVSDPAQLFAQAIVGVMIASHLPPSVFGEIARDWPVFLFGVTFTVFASGGLGWLLSRTDMLPGTTAIWGSAPGAASAMTIMSDAYGADMRLVAMMQYLRVVACVVTTTLVARVLGLSEPVGLPPGEVAVVAETLWLNVPPTLGIAAVGAVIGTVLRIPGGAMMVPMLLGILAKVVGLPVSLDLPMPVLALGFAVVGWSIGVRFTPEALRHALRLFPYLLLSTLTLILICSIFGVVLAHVAGVDLLTAYLATSPGGADSVAIIAAGAQADMSFVTAMQVLRFFIVLAVGPALASWLSQNRNRR